MNIKKSNKNTLLTYLILGALASPGHIQASDSVTLFSGIKTDGGTIDSDDDVEGLLKGPEIESCQRMSTGWKNGFPSDDDVWKKYMNTKIKKAKERLKEVTNMAEVQGYIDSSNSCDKSQLTETEEANCTVSGLTNNQSSNVIAMKEDLPSALNSFRSKLSRALNEVRRCIALHTVISNSSSKRSMSVKSDNKVGATAKSFDGKLVCESQGYETQDYKGCADSVKYYDMVFVGRKVVAAGQQFDYMDSSMDIQSDLAKNAQTDATAGLKAQKADIKKRAEMANTRAVTESVGFGLLLTSMNSIPSIDDLNKECIAKGDSKYAGSYESVRQQAEIAYKKARTIVVNLGKLKVGVENAAGTADGGTLAEGAGQEASASFNSSEIPNTLPNVELALSDACGTYVYDQANEGSHAMINNAGAREVIQQALIDSGVNIATMLGTAAILDKQADRVDDAIKLVDGHDPETLEYGGEDILTTECQLNPAAEGCAGGNTSEAVDYYNQGISVDGIQFANGDASLDPVDEFGNRVAPDSSGDTTRNGNPVGISSIDGVDKGGGLVDPIAGAATVKSTGGNGIGSGAGGGGGGGGGGGSAPANGSAKTGGPDGKKAFVGSAKKMKFSAGGGGLRFGTSSKRRVKKEKSKNPFANLFKKKGKKGGVMNFRGVASKVGKKNGSIFKMISNRYSIVNKEKRLLEYKKINGDLP